jgi:hypothetical protein
MPTISFEGETHDEIVRKVRRWLASLDGPESQLSAVQAIDRGAELTKDALQIIAAAAPGPIADSDVTKALVGAGYELTDGSRRAIVNALNALSDVTGGGVVKRVEGARKSVVYEMNAAVAKSILRALRG